MNTALKDISSNLNYLKLIILTALQVASLVIRVYMPIYNPMFSSLIRLGDSFLTILLLQTRVLKKYGM